MRATIANPLVRLAGGTLICILLSQPAAAFEQMMVREAWTAMQENRLILVDVRRQSEWERTGVAPGAVTLTMGADGFYERLETIAAENPGKVIALICASGGRSTIVARELEARGLTRIVDVDEGMIGGVLTSGWLGESLPVVKWED
jgi:rhodanese-related sulfurtransferase